MIKLDGGLERPVSAAVFKGGGQVTSTPRARCCLFPASPVSGWFTTLLHPVVVRARARARDLQRAAGLTATMADGGGTADGEPPVLDVSELSTLAAPMTGDVDLAAGPEEDGDQWRHEVISRDHDGRRRRSSVRDVIKMMKERTRMNESELEDALAREQGAPVSKRSSFLGILNRDRAATFTRSSFETAVRDTSDKYQRRATLLVKQAEKFITKEGTRR